MRSFLALYEISTVIRKRHFVGRVLDPLIETNLVIRTRKADELSDVAACEAIVGQLAGQDPPCGSKAARCLDVRP
jgi:hypothetical protein